ncbi:EAL domain-containing protein [Kineococcus sp. SYSU DK006]|uniref:EAL domain-containing protein n=1 Tax=Kineococcus sp. SYSU DK006 TaxID=3383127 RepID=UPI003D7E5453
MHLEVTEHEELPDDPSIAASLREVVAAGFHVDLDDVGTGCTSLSSVRRFPIPTVELDRSLTRLVTGGDTSLLEASRRCAARWTCGSWPRAWKEPGQLGPLQALGVSRAQGHPFDAAVDAGDVPGFVRRRAAQPARDEPEGEGALLR